MWTSTVGKFLKVVSCTSTLWKCASECRALCDEIGLGVSCRLVEEFSHELHRDTQQFFQVDPWEPHCRELYLGNDTWVEASIDSNWLSAGA